MLFIDEGIFSRYLLAKYFLIFVETKMVVVYLETGLNLVDQIEIVPSCPQNPNLVWLVTKNNRPLSMDTFPAVVVQSTFPLLLLGLSVPNEFIDIWYILLKTRNTNDFYEFIS